MALVVRRSRIHAVGVFTTTPVRKGARLDPNCEIDEIENRVWIFALRDISAGEELLWDYNHNLYDDETPAPRDDAPVPFWDEPAR
jgi:SET domain-containing protein